MVLSALCLEMLHLYYTFPCLDLLSFWCLTLFVQSCTIIHLGYCFSCTDALLLPSAPPPTFLNSKCEPVFYSRIANETSWADIIMQKELYVSPGWWKLCLDNFLKQKGKWQAHKRSKYQNRWLWTHFWTGTTSQSLEESHDSLGLMHSIILQNLWFYQRHGHYLSGGEGQEEQAHFTRNLDHGIWELKTKWVFLWPAQNHYNWEKLSTCTFRQERETWLSNSKKAEV